MRERYTGKSRGFGFVTFSTTAEAQLATAAEHVIDGRRCEAKFALPEGKVGSARTTRIFIARIPSSVTDLQFRGYFEQFGTVQDAYMPKDPSKQGHRGIGFVTYASPDSVEHVMTGTHVLNGNEVAIDRATPKERTQGATLPGRLSMSQPNLHMLSAAGGGGGSAHGGGAFPAFMRSSAGGLGSGVFPPHSPSYYYGDANNRGRGGGGGGLGSRHMSHPVLPTNNSQFGSPPHRGGGISGRGGGSVNNLSSSTTTTGAGYGGSSSATNLQAALQHHLSSNSLSSLDGTGSTSTTPHQQQLINLINANVAAAAAAASGAPAVPAAAVGLQQSSGGGSLHQFPPSGPSSTNDLTSILPQPQHDQPMHNPTWMHHPGGPSRNPSGAAAAAGNLQGGASGSEGGTSGGPPSSRAGPRIFVGKLNRETSDQDVKEYFSRFGYVLDVYLPRDKTNKREHRGFGFVTFETEASIQRVVSHVPHYIRGSVIAIDSAVPRQDEMMVLTIDTPAAVQYPSQMQYHQGNQYYPPPPGPPPPQQQQYYQHTVHHHAAVPLPMPAGAPPPPPPTAAVVGSGNLPASETLQAFEGLSLGPGSATTTTGGGSLS